MKILNKILGGVFPIGDRLTTDDNQVDNEIQNVIRNAGLTPTAEVSLTGTSSSVGTAVTGVGTLFLTELRIGDLFYKDSAINDVRRVANIASNLALTVESAFASDFSGQACSIFNVTQLTEALPLSIPDATTTQKGISELSTLTEAKGNTGGDRVITSDVLNGIINQVHNSTFSGASTVEKSWANDSNFNTYEVEINNLSVSNDDTTLYLRVSTDGGSTWKSAAASYKWIMFGSDSGSAAVPVQRSDSDTSLHISQSGGGTGVGNAANESYACKLIFYRPDLSKHHKFLGTATWDDTQFLYTVHIGGSYISAAEAINGIQIYPSVGTISGNIRITRS